MKTIQRPQPVLSERLGIKELWFKREDLHPYGSHKGRSIPLMIKDYHKREGYKQFIISSSGNAALAAAIAVEKHNQNNPGDPISLTIFIGQHIDPKKLTRLQSHVDGTYITIKQVERPKQEAFQMEKSGEAKYLRQSTDDAALRGYMELAKEMSNIPNLKAIFIPTSSGTTAQAIAQAFIDIDQSIQVHIVQTTACCPIASLFSNPIPEKTETSLAGAIVDHVAHRKEAVKTAVEQTGGSGWVVTDENIQSAVDDVKNASSFDISNNSALSVAGVKKALEHGWSWDGAVVAVITGE